MRKDLMRTAGAIALKRRLDTEGQELEISDVTGRGIPPGGRKKVSRGATTFQVAVRPSRQRALGFTRKPSGEWNILDNEQIGLVLAVIPDPQDADTVEVIAFDRIPLRGRYEAALAELRENGHPASAEIPVFISLDAKSRKNLGHEVSLRGAAIWTEFVNTGDIVPLRGRGIEAEDFFTRVRREFAEKIGARLEEVSVEFRVVGQSVW